MVGAGSAVFSRNLIADILSRPALRGAHLALVDTDNGRLETVTELAQAINTALGARAVISATTDRRAALPGADVVICTIGVGGLAAVKDDLEIPLRFGVRQTVGDTLGVGGIFRAARSIPEVLRLCEDMERWCPAAWLLNYTNPMAMHCLAIQRVSRIRVVGLCHGVPNTARTLRMIVAMRHAAPEAIATHFERPWNDPERHREWNAWMAMGDDPALSYTCAGINHMAFFLRFESGGTDLYPDLWRALEIPHLVRLDPVRFELFRWLGYFMTETSGHTAEYTPFFLRHPGEIERHHLRVADYIDTCRDLDAATHALRTRLQAGEPVIEQPYRISPEYASGIINAMATDATYRFNGNVHNRDGALIANLPGDCCVEVPCMADSDGVAPVAIGHLPPACAAMIRTNVNVQDLAVRGIVEGNREAIYQAAMLDPNTAATLPLPAIRALVDALFAAHAHRLAF